MRLVKLVLGSPEHGWLPVTLTGPGGEAVLAASDVPADSLQMLATAAANLLDGVGGEQDVTWFLEPVECRWIFRPDGERATVSVDYDGGTAALIAVGTVPEVCAVVWRALRRLEADPAWADPARGSRVWSHPFPHREVAQLGEALRRRRAARTAS